MAITTAAQVEELTRCYSSPAHFLTTHARIYDATRREWIPFELWPSQRAALATITSNNQVCVLKARQLGLTWLVLGHALWLMLYRPAAAVLLFSRRDEEAKYLLSGERLRGMWLRLPDWMRTGITATADGAHEWSLSNGSSARAFPTTGGRSYTDSLAIVDEADFADDLDGLLNAVKPTVDAGGKLILLSTADKSRPLSPFKRIYRAAQSGDNGYRPIFLSWQARPDRDADWYAAQRADVLARTGALDDLHQEYPATDTEALQGRTLDKRFPAEWLDRCYQPLQGQPSSLGTGVTIYAEPQAGRAYVIGADPAEGNPQSDESSATVLDVLSGEQMCVLAGKLDTSAFAPLLDALSRYYNAAPVMVERNNHGHAVRLWLGEFGRCQLYTGLDRKAGWLTTGNSKPLAVDNAAEMVRDAALIIHDPQTHMQLAMLDGATLRAPEGEHDDRALCLIMALAALRWRGEMPTPVHGHDPFRPLRQEQQPKHLELVTRTDELGRVRVAWGRKSEARDRGVRVLQWK